MLQSQALPLQPQQRLTQTQNFFLLVSIGLLVQISGFALVRKSI